MYVSIQHNEFNPHTVIISEKTRNNIMAGSDILRFRMKNSDKAQDKPAKQKSAILSLKGLST